MKRDQGEEKAEWIKYLEGNRCKELGWVGSQWQNGGEAALGVVGDAMRLSSMWWLERRGWVRSAHGIEMGT
jgi:hypothetical protein